MITSPRSVSALLLAAVWLAVAVAFSAFPSLFEPLSAQATDRLFRLRSDSERWRPAYNNTVIHVAIDDQDLEALGSYYLDRVQHGQLIKNLGRAGVAAQLHDFIFAAPIDDDNDQQLAKAFRRAGNAYLGMALGVAHGSRDEAPPVADPATAEILSQQRWQVRIEGNPATIPRASRRFLSFPLVAEQARGHGFLDVDSDRDGVYRKAPLLARDADGFLPSLPFRIICDFLDVPAERIVVRPGRSIVLEQARLPGADDRRDIRIPIDREARMVINFIGPFGTMDNYPFSTVYEASDDRFMMEDLKDLIEGKLAVVSWIATGGGDVGPVPVDAVYPLSGIHANVMHSILTEDFLAPWSRLRSFFLIELPLLIALWLLAQRLSTIPFLVSVAGLTGIYYLSAAAAFLYRGWIFNIPLPITLLVGSAVVIAAYQFHREAQARTVLRTTFDSFFPARVVDKVMDNPDSLIGHAQKKELTILFSDIKSFTTHTSKMEAGHVRDLLNEYFEQMVEIVFRHEGTLDKFIGDGLMVFFGDPQDQPDHAERCVRAALDMQAAARALNQRWASRGDMPLEIRVGINTGDVIVGNMGSERRVSYTVLGEPVNLAQRLESNAPIGGILISRRTRELLGQKIPVVARDPILVKGISDPIGVFEVPVDGTPKP